MLREFKKKNIKTMNNKKAKSTYRLLIESKKQIKWLWLVWLGGLSASLQIRGSPVQFLVWGTSLGCRPGP